MKVSYDPELRQSFPGHICIYKATQMLSYEERLAKTVIGFLKLLSMAPQKDLVVSKFPCLVQTGGL